MAQLLDSGIFSAVTTTGGIGVGWKLNFYITGTSTRLDTYPTEADAAAATNPNANPVVVPADGRIPACWLKDQDYKLILTDENGAPKNTTPVLPRPTSARIGFIQSGAGTVARTAESKMREAVSIEDFGAIGNGASSTADTAAFLAFNTWAKALPAGTAAVLNLARGATYMVADPRWPMNIPKLRVNGNGSTLKSSGTVNTLKMLLLPCYPLYSLVNATPIYGAVTRSLIATAAAGANTVTVTTLADAALYAVGETIVVASYVKQWEGHAPSHKYFEFPIITAINAGTGVITLDRRLVNTHLSTNPYLTPNSYVEGRAHIEKIEQASLWNIDHEYRDITFEKNAVNAAGAIIEGVYECGRNIRMIGCTADYFLPLVAENIRRERCTMRGAGEYDKCVTSFEGLENIYQGAMGSATSITTLKETRSEFRAGYNICPTAMELVDCKVSGTVATDVQLFSSYGFVEKLKITRGLHQFYPTYSTITGQTATLIEGAGGVVWTAATSLLSFDFSALNGAPQKFLSLAFVGARIMVTVIGGGEDKPNGIYGIVESVTGTGNGTAAIKINFNEAIVAGAQFTLFPEPWVVDIDGQDYVKTVKTRYTLRGVTLTTGYNVQNIITFGQLTSIKCEVVRPYTGATAGNINLEVYDTYPVNLNTRKLVDLKTGGTRIATQAANVGWTGAGGESAGANLSAASFASRVSSRINVIAPTMASTGPTQLPIVNLYLEFESPLGVRT